MTVTPIVVTLSNGKKVANFSSPHPFTFEDGTVLPACSPEHANHYKVEMIEDTVSESLKGDIYLYFRLSPQVIELMEMYGEMWENGLVDVVFCPLPMLTAMKEQYGSHAIYESPFRSVRMTDRISKLVSISKQCVL